MTTFYKKFVSKNGRVRYVPVSEYDGDLNDAFHEGTHLVVSQPGCRSRIYNVNPDYATVMAVVQRYKTDLASCIVRASEMRNKQEPLTEEQKQAWETLKQVFGSERFYVTYPSANDIIEVLNDLLIKESNKLLTNPTLKKAWDNFQLLAGLSK